MYNVNMIINKKFLKIIKPILTQLKNKIGDDFIVFGSVPLYLFGVINFDKSINDLDIAIKDKKVVPREAKEVTFQKNPNQKLYKFKIDNIEIDIGACWKGQESYFYKLFENPIEVEGFKFANLEILEEWKKIMVKKYNREKDKIFLKKIREYKLNPKDE